MKEINQLIGPDTPGQLIGPDTPGHWYKKKVVCILFPFIAQCQFSRETLPSLSITFDLIFLFKYYIYCYAWI